MMILIYFSYFAENFKFFLDKKYYKYDIIIWKLHKSMINSISINSIKYR